MPRIEPLNPPYAPDVADRLTRMMPDGAPPILLFRTLARNLPMTAAMGGWGGYELGSELSLTMRDREILIDRTCVRCNCEYEWAVHVAFFAHRVGLDDAQVASLVHGGPHDRCWTDERDRLLIAAADALHDRGTVDDRLARRLSAVFDDDELLDLYMLCGWYHAIAFTANGAGVDHEPGTPRFADYAGYTDCAD